MMKWHEWAAAADEAKAKGQLGLEFSNRQASGKTALVEAVRMPQAQGQEWLSNSNVVAQLESVVAYGDLNREEYNTDLIDLALLLGRRDLAEALLKISKSPFGDFWIEYRKAIAALLDGKAYRAPTALKAKGFIATLVPNLRLAEALATNGDRDSAIREVDDAFAKRQRDKRVHDPASLDGDGHLPVLWNLRKKALFAAAGKSAQAA